MTATISTAAGTTVVAGRVAALIAKLLRHREAVERYGFGCLELHWTHDKVRAMLRAGLDDEPRDV